MSAFTCITVLIDLDLHIFPNVPDNRVTTCFSSSSLGARIELTSVVVHAERSTGVSHLPCATAVATTANTANSDSFIVTWIVVSIVKKKYVSKG